MVFVKTEKQKPFSCNQSWDRDEGDRNKRALIVSKLLYECMNYFQSQYFYIHILFLVDLCLNHGQSFSCSFWSNFQFSLNIFMAENEKIYFIFHQPTIEQPSHAFDNQNGDFTLCWRKLHHIIASQYEIKSTNINQKNKPQVYGQFGGNFVKFPLQSISLCVAHQLKYNLSVTKFEMIQTVNISF